MTVSSVGIHRLYSKELEEKSPLEILGEEYFKNIKKKYSSKIFGNIKSIIFLCKYKNEYCECGGEGNNYCSDCGGELKYSHLYNKYTEYPRHTAQNEEMARERFIKRYGLGGAQEGVIVTKKINI